MTCSRCGHPNAAGAKFCVNCGQPLIILPSTPPIAPAEPPAFAPAEQGAAAPVDTASVAFWINEVRRYGWRLWPVALLLVYVVWTKNIMVLAIGLAITWLIRTYATRFDEVLRPIWPYRNWIPPKSRKILGWIVPVAFSLYISLTPSVWPLLGWVPIVGPTASLTILTSLLAATIAYVLVREPAHAAAR